jgi:hypothetical protein
MTSEIGHCTYHGRFDVSTKVTKVGSGTAIVGTRRDCDSTSQSTVLGVKVVWSYLR